MTPAAGFPKTHRGLATQRLAIRQGMTVSSPAVGGVGALSLNKLGNRCPLWPGQARFHKLQLPDSSCDVARVTRAAGSCPSTSFLVSMCEWSCSGRRPVRKSILNCAMDRIAANYKSPRRMHSFLTVIERDLCKGCTSSCDASSDKDNSETRKPHL